MYEEHIASMNERRYWNEIPRPAAVYFKLFGNIMYTKPMLVAYACMTVMLKALCGMLDWIQRMSQHDR